MSKRDCCIEILSKVHKHLKTEEKQESEVQGIKESVMASTEKEDLGSDGESDTSVLNISLLTLRMRALEINLKIVGKN